MRIALPSSTNREILERQIRNDHGISDAQRIRLCAGLCHALPETARGLFSQYPHRTIMAVQKDGGPHFEALITLFSREGFKVLEFTKSDFANPAKFIEGMGKNGLFVLASEDDPLTGEIFDLEKIRDELAKQRIFFVTVSSSLHVREKTNMAFHDVSSRLLVLGEGLTLCLDGARVLVDPLLRGEVEVWGKYEPAVSGENEVQVKEFEKKLKSVASPVLKEADSRLFDRAVLSFRDLDGSAVLETFRGQKNIKDGQTGFHRLIEAPSLCRWGDSLSQNWLRARGWDPGFIRGMVVFDASLATDENARLLVELANELKMKFGIS